MHENILNMNVSKIDVARSLAQAVDRAMSVINAEVEATECKLSDVEYKSVRRAFGWMMASEAGDFVHRLQQQHPLLIEEENKYV